ncbi:MAG: RNA polymerase sigma-70 factor [Bacteroidota bacterium]|nr:RNA polymerase sigma-70 factor [Odoribacter sp.]MDP3644393.1 RNA polymerase sigma-70 factor [Bacteroidota bacterium]
MPGKCDDKLLVQLLQKGNVTAFDSLFEVYSPKLYGFALKYFKNETDAEELVQEVFIKVWENHHTLKSELSFKSYLFTIALNQIRKHFNKKATSLRYLESLQNDPEFSDQITTDDYETTLRQIYRIIDQMPERRREIFLKSKLEGKSSKEIAAEINISTGAVDNQVSEALLFIRSRINIETHTLLLFSFLFIY